MALKYIARGKKIDLSELPKILFVSDKKSYEKYFKILSEEILELHNCVIFYDDWKKNRWGTKIENCVSEMQMAILPVSRYLLESKGKYIDKIILNLIENRIPLLPIFMENDEIFFQDYMEKISFDLKDIQILFRESENLNEIPYKEKLKKRIETIIVDEKIVEKIKKVFQTHIFLSYRKKDRDEAKKIISEIHKIREYQDIAIWYDEYLTPGENWRQELYNKLLGCDVMILCVTPSLLERGNYVHKYEYPDAVKNNVVVVPIMMIKTNKKEMRSLYGGVKKIYRLEDIGKKNILEFCNKVELKKTEVDEEYNYLVGMAYMNGIEVEKNVGIAIEWLMKSCEEKFIPAMEMLAKIYEYGIGVKIDVNKVISIQKEIVQLAEGDWLSEKSIESLEKYTNYVLRLVDNYVKIYEIDCAVELLHRSMKYIDSVVRAENEDRKSFYIVSKTYRDLLICKTKLGDIYMKIDEFHKAKEIYFETNIYFREMSKEVRSVEIGLDLAMSDMKLGECFLTLYKMQANLQNRENIYSALHWVKQAITVFESLEEQVFEIRAIRGFANSLKLFAECEREIGEFERAIDVLNRVVEYRESIYQLTRQLKDQELLAETHLLIAYTYFDSYQQIGYGDYKKIIKEIENAISYQESIVDKQGGISYKIKLAYSYYYLGEGYANDYDFKNYNKWKKYAEEYLMCLQKQYKISLEKVRKDHKINDLIFYLTSDIEQTGLKALTKKEYFKNYILYDE